MQELIDSNNKTKGSSLDLKIPDLDDSVEKFGTGAWITTILFLFIILLGILGSLVGLMGQRQETWAKCLVAFSFVENTKKLF